MEQQSQLLFLCTGNYYRSRFAEHYFNYHAPSFGLDWVAFSRGLAVDRFENEGAISPFAREGLQKRQIPLGEPLRLPKLVTEEELAQAALIVAVKEAEHRPLMIERFPHSVDSVEYWHVHDLDYASAEDALAQLEKDVQALLERLATRKNNRAEINSEV